MAPCALLRVIYPLICLSLLLLFLLSPATGFIAPSSISSTAFKPYQTAATSSASSALCAIGALAKKAKQAEVRKWAESNSCPEIDSLISMMDDESQPSSSGTIIKVRGGAAGDVTPPSE